MERVRDSWFLDHTHLSLETIHDFTNEQNKLAIKTSCSEQNLKKVHMALSISKLRIT